MTHTTFEEIEKHLKHGLHVVVENENKRCVVFSPNKDLHGNYRTSMWCNTKEKSMETIGALPGYIRSLVSQLAEIESWKIVNRFHTPAEPYEPGEKVERIASGEIFTIESVHSDGFIYTLAEEYGFYAHTELRPVLPTYEDDDATQDAIQLLKDNGYTITKK